MSDPGTPPDGSSRIISEVPGGLRSTMGGADRAGHHAGSLATKSETLVSRYEPKTSPYSSPTNPSITVHPLHYSAIVEAKTTATALATEGQSVTTQFPETLHRSEETGGTLEIKAGGLNAKVTQVPNDYLERFQDDNGDARLLNPPANTFLLNIGGQEIIVNPPNSNDVVGLRPEGMNDQKVGDLIKLLDEVPDLPKDVYATVVDRAHKAVVNAPEIEFPADKAKQTPIRIHFYTTIARNPRTGLMEDSLIINPEFYGGGELRWIDRSGGRPEEVGDLISEKGGLLPLAAVTPASVQTGPHFTLEILGSRVTVVDGDGYGRSSSYGGAEVRLLSNFPTPS